MVLLGRSNSPSCFYCLSVPNPPPIDPRAFRCAHCGCWNRYDHNGDISSDEPAMHDESLNAASFAKRASPSKDRLPSAYPKPPFCHTCQTNQMLILNLLSNYLPPPQHPDYPHRLEQLPAYRDSLHVRYPPVCPNCLPAVEDEIEQKNHMARTRALAGWLQESKGKDRRRLRPPSGPSPNLFPFQLAIWRLRGFLWSTTLLAVLLAHAAAIRGYHFPHPLTSAIPALPFISLFSLFYTAWNPTYYRFQRAIAQGRDVRIKGKSLYIILQALAWLSRFTTSLLLLFSLRSSSWDYLHIALYPSSHRLATYCSVSLVIELLVLSSSFTVLHLQRPPTIRLTSSVRETPESSLHSARATPMPPNDPDLLASLTLSSKPLIPASNPIFGHPSLAVPTAPIRSDETPDDDAMDWTPTIPSPVKPKETVDDGQGLLRPQRFFPPERPTGLETLFASAKLDDGDAKPTSPTCSSFWTTKSIGWWLTTITLALVPLAAVVYHRSIRGLIQ